MIRTTLLAAVAAVALVPGAASAQAPAPATAAATVTTGATIYDTSGGTVGTVASTDGTNAVIDTGAVKAAVPIASIGKGAKGPVLAMTKAELDAAAGAQQQQASADFAAKLVPGAAVHDTAGGSLGTIKTVDADSVTLTTPQGDAKLPKNGFGPGPQGITLGMTAAQLSAAMGAAAPAAGSTSTTTSSTTTSTAPTTGVAPTPTDAGAATPTETTTTTTTKTKKKPK